MKKFFTYGAIALASLATVGCNQEVFVEVNPSVSGGLTEIYVTREANGTKTTWLDSNNPSVIVWGANDQLSVFSTDNPEEPQNIFFYTTSDAYTEYAKTWGTLTFTHGTAVPGTAPYWSIFPYNRSNAMVDGHPQFPFMYNQTARAHYFDPQAFAAASYSENLSFNFKNLFGLLELKVGEANVTSVTLKGNKQGDAFGSVYTVLGFAGELYANPNDSNVEEITLTPDEDTFTVGETYYMVVPPKEFSEGATFTLYNGSTKVAELSTSGAVSVERNKVHSVPVLTESEPTVGPGNTVAEIVAQITSADKDNPSAYSVDLAGAVVSYVNGSNAYIEDKSGAILLYMADNGLAAGDIISGALSGTGYLYNGLPEITSLGGSYVKATGGAIPLTEITLTELAANHTANLSRRILVKGVTVTDGIKDSDRDGAIQAGDGGSYAVRAQKNNLQLNKGDIGDLILFVGVYNTTNQLSFWDNSFFTQTGAITNLTVPESLSVSAGSTKTISVETNSTGAVSFKSSNISVATVDDKGVVTGVTEGSATITVSVAADGFYSAIEKTCAVTVTAALAGNKVYLTNDEIKAAVANTAGKYEDFTITSESGLWSANAYRASDLTYLQIRNKTGAKVVSPTFSSNIDKVVIDMASNATANRTLHAIPSDTEVPTGSSTYASTLWASEYGNVKTGTSGDEVTIEFTGDTKDFILVVEGGSTYIDAITVYLK